MEEPGATGLLGNAQFGEGGIQVTERNVRRGSEGGEEEAFPAEPLQPLEDGVSFV
jgi:hypothetical protein